MKPCLLIRCDASFSLGMGHLVRCLVLAEAFIEKNFSVVFILRDSAELAIERLKENKAAFVLLDSTQDYAQQMLAFANHYRPSIFLGDVRDGLPDEVIEVYRAQGILTVALDEPSDYAKLCDLCFYPPHARIDIAGYRGRVFQGLESVVLRPEFYRPRQKIKNTKPHVMVMMGGTDPHNLSYAVVQALHKTYAERIFIEVVVRPDHPDLHALKALGSNVKVISGIEEMADYLDHIDYAVIAFGTSAYELLVKQIPAFYLLLSEEAKGSVQWFEDQGCGRGVEMTQDLAFDFSLLRPVNNLMSHSEVVEKILMVWMQSK
jgi:spore coat polysaccharide biosynthesis protein SpsF